MPTFPRSAMISGLASPIHLLESSSRPTRRSKTPRRRRLSPRAECRVPHAFDQLPWISTLDSAPELTNPWDIADLSLLPDDDSGPGPVRRRKTSLRSNPLDLPLPPLRDSSLSTPRSRFVPSRVLFHNLMPISCDDDSL